MSNTSLAGIASRKKHSSDARRHADGRGVNHHVEHARLGLIARKRLGAGQRGQRAHAIQIAAGDRQLRSRGGQGERRAARRAAVAHHQHGALGDAHMPLQRNGHAGRVGIGSAPLPRFAPDRIHRSDAPRQRVHLIQVAQDFLLVRNGDAEAGQRQPVRPAA